MLHIALNILMREFGKPMPYVSLNLVHKLTFKYTSPSDFQNDVGTPQSYEVIDIALKILICEFGKPRLECCPGILSASSISEAMIPGDHEKIVL